MMDVQQRGIQEDFVCRVDSICDCNIGDKGDNDDTANTISSSKNVDIIDYEQKLPVPLVSL